MGHYYWSGNGRFQTQRSRPFWATVCLCFLSIPLLLPLLCDIYNDEDRSSWAPKTRGQNPIFLRNRTAVRKLLRAADAEYHHGLPRKQAPTTGAATEERMGEDGCSRDDVAVYQGETPPLPNGIPTYTVEILNVCVSGCSVSNIHVRCGWFSSARLINPRIFRRVGFDDCLVNDGAALPPGGSLSFQYANTYRYPLSVSSLACGGTL